MAMIASVEGLRVANTKRRLAKTKTPPRAVNLGAWLRIYAPNEKNTRGRNEESGERKSEAIRCGRSGRWYWREVIEKY